MSSEMKVKTHYPSFSDLKKPVARRTLEEHSTARRKLIVMFYPGDRIGFREAGRRRWYFADIHRLYTSVVRWTVEAEVKEKVEKRKRGLK
jgi:hypothetical protein